jgi:hypothetical protein
MYVYTEDAALVNLAAAWGISAGEDEDGWAVIAQFGEEFYLLLASAEDEDEANAKLDHIRDAIKNGVTYLDMTA